MCLRRSASGMGDGSPRGNALGRGNPSVKDAAQAGTALGIAAPDLFKPEESIPVMILAPSGLLRPAHLYHAIVPPERPLEPEAIVPKAVNFKVAGLAGGHAFKVRRLGFLVNDIADG